MLQSTVKEIWSMQSICSHFEWNWTAAEHLQIEKGIPWSCCTLSVLSWWAFLDFTYLVGGNAGS